MGKRKIEMVLDDEAQAVLAELQRATGAPTMAAVLRDALGVYYTLFGMLKPGQRQLAVVDHATSTLETLDIPSLVQSPSPPAKPDRTVS